MVFIKKIIGNSINLKKRPICLSNNPYALATYNLRYSKSDIPKITCKNS